MEDHPIITPAECTDEQTAQVSGGVIPIIFSAPVTEPENAVRPSAPQQPGCTVCGTGHR